MSKRPAELLIEDIWESLERIERYVGRMSEAVFEADEKTIDAVVRNFEIIGEAANRLPEDFKLKHSTVEWVKIVGLRHRIVHDYFGLDLKMIWKIVRSDLPEFKTALERIRDEFKL